MTTMDAMFLSSASVHNQQTFDIGLAVTLRGLANLELSAVVGEHPLTRDLPLGCADQIDRHAQDLAALAGFPNTDVVSYGQGWYAGNQPHTPRSFSSGLSPSALSSFLEPKQGTTTAGMLVSVAAAIRALANQEVEVDRMTHSLQKPN